MSIENTANRALREVNKVLMAYMPEPSCPQKKDKWRWEIEQVKKRVAAQLNPEGNGIEIKITI